jgi:hypothetical protein
MANLPKIGAIPKNRAEDAAAWMPLAFPFWCINSSIMELVVSN